MGGQSPRRLAERGGTETDPVFVSNRNQRLSCDAVEQIARKPVLTASWKCPSLKKKRVTPHVLRHSAAMQLLQNGVDRTVIALWLGDESVETTQMYIQRVAPTCMRQAMRSRSGTRKCRNR